MSKKIIQSKILENTELVKEIYRLVLQVEGTDHIKPGQFVNVYLDNKSMLLPRPISICSYKDREMTLVYKIVGRGTQELAEYQPGQLLRVSTSQGNGFQLDHLFSTLAEKPEPKAIALVGGGVGVPPLISLATALGKKQGESVDAKVIAILGFQEDPFLVSEFQALCDEVYVATDKGTSGFHGTVLDLMKEKKLKLDYCLACGPKPMLKALWSYCDKAAVPLQVSMEERMGCGYGACVGCTCKTKANAGEEGEQVSIINKKVCTDGPVFMGNEVVWDE
ncbi:MAG: dihydroorotate dehydrogenase electron transfer subunit [Anaerovoracaceae bacterium]